MPAGSASQFNAQAVSAGEMGPKDSGWELGPLPFSLWRRSLLRMAAAPPSCCLVAFPPRAKDGLVVFGKNSARPRDEVQEVVYFPASDHEPESKVEVSEVLRPPDARPLFLSLRPGRREVSPGSLPSSPDRQASSVDSRFHEVCVWPSKQGPVEDSGFVAMTPIL